MPQSTTSRKLHQVLPLQGLIEMLSRLSEEPFPQPDARGCWYSNIPVAQVAVDGTRASQAFRQTCIEMLLLGCKILRARKPDDLPFVRVVAVITLPKLFESSIDVFFDKTSYTAFTERSTVWQTWVALSPERSLLREWAIPEGLSLPERGYHETIRDEDYARDGEVWLLGDVGVAHNNR